MPSAEDDNPDRAAPVRKPVIRNINSHGEISRKSTHNSRNENEIIARIDSERATAATRKAVIALREPESMVIGLLYQGDLVQSQVGEILGVAQSRVSQIKHSGLRKLRARPELRKLAA
jgi:RNA polymerase sigma factor (sigma-70 family)